MERKSMNVHAVTVHLYSVAIIVLVLLLLVVGVKYVHLEMAVKDYTNSTIYLNSQNKDDDQLGDYSTVLSESVSAVPAANLQNYITRLAKNLNRYIVVLDKNNKILATNINTNIGGNYTYDLNNVISKTLADGEIRSFEEKSVLYPSGINMLVVPSKNASGQISGVVLISNIKLSK